ncbi:hypothetical protein TNCV_4257741 [Trichonephila clavipes]|nr:hypothetical protein TNCV_4257741 [Trichonephila clavipes]
MGCGLVVYHCRPSTFPSPHKILTQSFLPREWHLSTDDANLYYDLSLLKASKPSRHSRDLLQAVQSNDMATVDFLHHENSPTSVGVESTTLGAEGQRQTINATQPVIYLIN